MTKDFFFSFSLAQYIHAYVYVKLPIEIHGCHGFPSHESVASSKRRPVATLTRGCSCASRHREKRPTRHGCLVPLVPGSGLGGNRVVNNPYIYIWFIMLNGVYIIVSICIYIYIWLVVSTILKNMSSSVGMMTFPIHGKIKNVPNHQPV